MFLVRTHHQRDYTPYVMPHPHSVTVLVHVILLSCPPGSAYNPVSTEAPTPTLSYNCSSGVSLLRFLNCVEHQLRHHRNLISAHSWWFVKRQPLPLDVLALGMTYQRKCNDHGRFGDLQWTLHIAKPATRVTDPCDQPGLKTQDHRLLHPRM
ncbi:hypothetical protein BGW80DRAFT_1314769 [Lactifluus volemus]|nr:hypothetical protein BGW80DRAFT_1314769 [Lactifluus volemus]